MAGAMDPSRPRTLPRSSLRRLQQPRLGRDAGGQLPLSRTAGTRPGRLAPPAAAALLRRVLPPQLRTTGPSSPPTRACATSTAAASRGCGRRSSARLEVIGGAIWSGIDDVFLLPSGRATGYGEWGPDRRLAAGEAGILAHQEVLLAGQDRSGPRRRAGVPASRSSFRSRTGTTSPTSANAGSTGGSAGRQAARTIDARAAPDGDPEDPAGDGRSRGEGPSCRRHGPARLSRRQHRYRRRGGRSGAAALPADRPSDGRRSSS